MSGADVLAERHDGVLLLRLNRPHRHNAIGGTMLRDLAEAFDEAAADNSVRVVVTTGAGDAFCVGADGADLDGSSSAAGPRAAHRQRRRRREGPAAAVPARPQPR